jgi:hypothetical protein
MSRPRLVLLLALGLSSFFVDGGAALAEDAPSIEPSSAAREKSESVKERAKGLVMKATDAALADQWPLAEDLFRRAWEIEKTYDIAGNLGHIELLNGKPLEAAQHLRFCLDGLPPSETDAQRVRVQERFNEARRQIGAISIDLSEAGADVLVDGRSVGASPLVAEVLVAPGLHRVRAVKSGFDVTEESVDVEKGGSRSVTLSIKPSRPLPAASSSAAPIAPLASSVASVASVASIAGAKPPADVAAGSSLNLGLIATGSLLTVTSLVFGASFYAASMNREGDATLLRSRLDKKNGPTACYDEPALAAPCADLETATNSGAAMRIGYEIAFGVAGAAAAGTVAYLIFGRSSRDPKRATTVLPSVTGNAGGLLVTSVW